MTYHIESPHSKEECLQALDEVLARGPKLLAQFDWGCMAGQHVGWATVDAGSETEARWLCNRASVFSIDFAPALVSSTLPCPKFLPPLTAVFTGVGVRVHPRADVG